jgi:hypothetical protein
MARRRLVPVVGGVVLATLIGVGVASHRSSPAGGSPPKPGTANIEAKEHAARIQAAKGIDEQPPEIRRTYFKTEIELGEGAVAVQKQALERLERAVTAADPKSDPASLRTEIDRLRRSIAQREQRLSEYRARLGAT